MTVGLLPGVFISDISGFATDGASPLQAAVGGCTGWVNGDDSGQDGLPLALGGYLKYTFPRLKRVSLRGEAWFAPDALCAGDLDKFRIIRCVSPIASSIRLICMSVCVTCEVIAVMTRKLTSTMAR